MGLVLIAIGAVAVIPIGYWFVAQPMRSVVPIYAATLPIASAVSLAIPLPSPFNTLSTLLGGVAIGTISLHLLVYRRGRVPPLPVAAWLLFLAWGGVTAFWAIAPGDSVSTLLVAVPLLLLMALVSLVDADQTDLDVLRVAIIVSGVVVGLYALGLLVSGAPLPSHGVSERFSIVSTADETNPNILAASLLLPMALSVERIVLGGSRWWRAGYWRALGAAGLFFTVLSIVLTSSRGGIISGIAVLVVGLLYCGRVPGARAMVWRVILAIAAIVCALIAFAVLSTVVVGIDPMARLLTSTPVVRITERDTDSSGRLEIWNAGVIVCKQSCTLGVGFGNFPDAYNEVLAFTGADENVGWNRPAHNVYIGLAVEVGVVGLGLLTLALLLEWLTLSRPEVFRSAPVLKAALAGLLVASLFLSAIWFKYFWLVFVVIRVAESAAARPRAAPVAPEAGSFRRSLTGVGP